MDDRLLLGQIDLADHTVNCGGVTYPLNEKVFPTLDPAHPYDLTEGERAVIDDLTAAFLGSAALKRHITFLYENGGMYRVYNGNLLYHGCVPLNDDGTFRELHLFGGACSGKALFDMAEQRARGAFFKRSKEQAEVDFMWYLFRGEHSPLNGRKTKAFERAYIDDRAAWQEDKNPYYRYYYQRETCERILEEFGLQGAMAHIVNGHTPVRTVKGELPIRAQGKLLVIDGGFCKNYHAATGIAGYTLIYDSHGLRLKAHRPFKSIDAALGENRDIHSSSEIVETERRRVMVYATDDGEVIQQEIADLCTLLDVYRSGQREILKEPGAGMR